MTLNPFLFDLDNQPVLEFTILKRDNSIYDLTGTTVDLLVEGVGTFSCAITNALGGECTRTVSVGDFPLAGRYRAQLRVSGGGPIFHTDIFVIQVSQSINTTAIGPVPPSLFPAVGGVIFGATAGQIGQDLTNFFWDDTNNKLQLFNSNTVFSNGAITHAGNLILSAGTPASGATTDGVNYWVADRNGAGTASPFVRTEDSGLNERLIGVTVQAFDTTERSTTSTGSVDLSTLTVNIPAGDGFIITGLVRKTAGAAAAVSLGLKVNGTVIFANAAISSATNQAELGSFGVGTEAGFALARDTNYTQSQVFQARTGPVGTSNTFANITYSNPLPTGNITSITVTGLTGSASVTLAIKNITVYRVART